jgi:hypothetical protein
MFCCGSSRAISCKARLIRGVHGNRSAVLRFGLCRRVFGAIAGVLRNFANSPLMYSFRALPSCVPARKYQEMGDSAVVETRS